MIEPQAIWQTLDFVYRALLRHRRGALGVTVSVALLVTAGVALMPKTYLSEAKLFVRFGRENQLDPTATSGQAISISETRESEINSLQEILRSRALLDRVVSTLGPEYILQGKSLPHGPEVTPVSTKSAIDADRTHKQPLFVPTQKHQLAVKKLEKDLEIFSPRKTTVIGLRCKAERPEVAQQIVAKLVEIYLDEHVRVHRTPGSFEFFESQTKAFHKQWQTAAQDLQQFKTKQGIVTLDGKRTQLQTQITDLEQRLLAAESEVTASEARIVSLKESIRLLPEFIASQKVKQPSVAMEGMKQTLFTLQGKQQELRSKMTDIHPMVVATQHQMQDLKDILDDQNTDSVAQTHVINPARQTLELDLLKEQSTVESLGGRIKSLREQKAEHYGSLATLNGAEVRLFNLQRDVDLSETRYRNYAEKLEQARINRSLDEERISSLSIVQPASYPIQPLGPRKLMIVGLGGFVALGAGLILALGLAWFNPVLINAELIQRQLQLPVLGTIGVR